MNLRHYNEGTKTQILEVSISDDFAVQVNFQCNYSKVYMVRWIISYLRLVSISLKSQLW